MDSVLTIAVKKGHSEIIGFLLDNGADPTEIDDSGISPLYRAIKENKFAVLEALLLKIDIKNVADEDSNTPLITAIRSNSAMNIIQLLVQNGVDINKSNCAKTPLAWAAEVGALETVKFLVEKGADVNLLSCDGNTPLGTAARFKRLEVAKFLVDQHPDTDNTFKEDTEGKSPLHWAVLNEDSEMINLLLEHGATISDDLFMDAIKTNNINQVTLLIAYGAPINRKDAPTPLQMALDMGSSEIASLLIQHGARVADLGSNAISKIWDFREADNIAMVQLLVENGANINGPGDCGETLLTKAVHLGKFEFVKYFVQLGADVNRANIDGLTPLAVAAWKKEFRAFEYLLDSGAVVTDEDIRRNVGVEVFYEAVRGRKP